MPGLPDIRLRRGIAADAEELAIVHVAAWREAYAGLMPDDILGSLDTHKRAVMWREVMARAASVQLAEQNGAIVGFGSTGPQRDPSLSFSAEIQALYVLRRAQRRGIGRLLMAAMASDLLEQGHATALLWVLENNLAARRFYHGLGGKEVSRREQRREGFSAIGIAYGWENLTTLI